jgi:hypothetical protein
MKKYLTIVIEYEGVNPPITGFGVPVLGCEVVAIAMGNEIGRSFDLQEKLESIGGNLDD